MVHNEAEGVAMLTTPSRAPTKSAKNLPSYSYFHELMKRYQIKDLVNVDHDSFLQQLTTFCDLEDAAMEGFADPARQHPIAVQFHWGHRHNFGEFSMPGRMGNHHIAVITTFVDELGAIPRDLSGKRVLDIGCWTGGTSLLLCAMGAEVVAIEEVKKYAATADYLGRAFGIDTLEVRHTSLYDCTTPEYQDAFDIVLFPGVLHHLSDPKLALRITFNCLRDGGICLLETLSYDHDPWIRARCAAETDPGSSPDPWGWNWLLFKPETLSKTLRDVGYELCCPCVAIDNRTLVAARRERHVDMWRAGLSMRTIR